jgi:uncharacterized caspase-like protein/biotin carboxyl carrier protein
VWAICHRIVISRLSLSTIFPAPELPPGPRSALIVATSAYEDARLGALRAPARDAADLADVLSDPKLGNFEVTEARDTGVQELRLSVADFVEKQDRDATVVVYLSCHGLLTARRQLYFATSNTDKDRLKATAIEARWLIDCLDECQARRQVVIFDCCFSGAFTNTKGPSDVKLEERLEIVPEPGRGRTILTASRSTEYSFEGEALNSGEVQGSVFTSALVKGLRTGEADTDRDGYISVSEAYSYAYNQVKNVKVAQTPQRWLYGGEGEEVILSRSPIGIIVEPSVLHDDIQAGLQSRFPKLRIGAVNALSAWLADPDPARIVAARDALKEVAEQDIREVALVAQAYLSAYPPNPLRPVDTGRQSSDTIRQESKLVPVVLPQMDESIVNAIVTRWLKRQGDPVQVDEPLLEIATDKVDIEIPSPVAGYLRHIAVSENETVVRGIILAMIEEYP